MSISFNSLSILCVDDAILLCMQEVANDALGCFPVYECRLQGELCAFVCGVGDIGASGYSAVIDTADK